MTQHAPLVIDVAGPTLGPQDRRRLSHRLTGGVILFARNFQSRVQLTQLCAQIQALRSDLLIVVDHEGGRVQRFKTDGFTHLPPMRVLGEMWEADARSGASRAMQAASACGYVMAAELRACGVAMSFAPVLDLDHKKEGRSVSGVLGDRTLHADPRVVTALANALMHGMLLCGMRSCGKHFPGHGFVAADSHVDTPVDRRSLRTILQEDALPYELAGVVLHSLMPAHVVYPKVDARPAGFSRRWLREILRERLCFDGAIFSDDLAMQGARYLDGREVSPTEAACAALQAGCDMVLLCNQSIVNEGRAIDELLDNLDALRGVAWQACAASEARRLALLPPLPALAWEALREQSLYRSCLELLPGARLARRSRRMPGEG